MKKPQPKPPKPHAFWVIDTEMEGYSEGTYSVMGPFVSQKHAEDFITNIAAQDWLTSCGCLRQPDSRETWGSHHIIVQEVRHVRPLPPATVAMTLEDVPPINPKESRSSCP